MLKEFKEFAMRGNVVDLAVGVVIGAAFGKIVSSFVNDILMPPLGVLVGNMDFSQLTLALKQTGLDGKPVTLNYGAFINKCVDFLIVAFCVFLVVKVFNSLKKSGPAPTPSEKICPECALAIPLQAKRCGHCTTALVTA